MTSHLLRFNSPIYNLQVFLRTISRRYPDIPPVLPDGVYGNATVKAVEAFQKKFLLPANGITGNETWNGIVEVYKQIERETSPQNLNIYPEEGLNPDGKSFGVTVVVMQSMINALSEQFTNIPPVSINGVLDEQTMTAIITMQKAFGLNPDGNITPLFWNYLSSVYEAYISTDRVNNKAIF